MTDAELKEWVKDHRAEAYRWWQSWVSELEAAGRSRSWIEPKGGWWRPSRSAWP
ncbi:MAG: hypothetical protein H0V05_06205 [Euzebyaceae bacterium]|nr:hypothetical protein [Euzebyaceae bacterium]